jgi:hypothetical protein
VNFEAKAAFIVWTADALVTFGVAAALTGSGMGFFSAAARAMFWPFWFAYRAAEMLVGAK